MARSVAKPKSRNHHGLATHMHRPSLNKLTKQQRITLAQNRGMRDRKDIKITLAKEPWRKENE